MKLVLLISILTIIASCQNERFKVPESKYRLDFPVIIDELNKHTMSTAFNKRKTTGDHRYYYIGEKKDTIQINRHIGPPIPPPPPIRNIVFNKNGSVKKVINLKKKSKERKVDVKKDQFSPYFIEYSQYTGKIDYTPVDLKITVDTSQVINNVTVKSYPVMIENISQDTFFISEYWYSPLILEAVDTNNEMKPIERIFRRTCGNGMNHFIAIPPKKIIISSVNVYSGDYSTKMRLRIGDNVSNEFYGNINLEQFKKRR